MNGTTKEATAPDFGEKARLAPAFFTAKADRKLASRVNEAVDRGIAWLKARQKENGSWGPFGASNGTYQAGPTAIALLALLVSGVNKYDRCVARGFDWLLKTTPRMTYEIALAMMALEQKAAPLHEPFELARLSPKERKNFHFVRNLDERKARFMEFCRDRILAHHARGGALRYRADLGSGDISNGQYAVLGLKAAARCGLAVDPKVWKKVLDYYLSSQEREGPKTSLPRFNGFARDGSSRFYLERAEARGCLRGEPVHRRPRLVPRGGFLSAGETEGRRELELPERRMGNARGQHILRPPFPQALHPSSGDHRGALKKKEKNPLEKSCNHHSLSATS